MLGNDHLTLRVGGRGLSIFFCCQILEKIFLPERLTKINNLTAVFNKKFW
jgi:hypothetical protein